MQDLAAFLLDTPTISTLLSPAATVCDHVRLVGVPVPVPSDDVFPLTIPIDEGDAETDELIEALIL